MFFYLNVEFGTVFAMKKVSHTNVRPLINQRRPSMANNPQNKTTWTGYGSSFTREQERDVTRQQGVDAVLGGQIWRVKPDEEAKAATPCIWMQAGVVRFKTCNNFYDCTTCKYDQGMQARVAQGKQISWQEAMRRRSGLDRVCRHTLTGRIGHRSCPYNYECATCDFDQYFEDVLSPKTGNLVGEKHSVKGFELPVGYYFHQGHTWARIESGGMIRVGLDDFSTKLFGAMDGFQLPVMGKVVEQDSPGWGMSRKGNQAEVLSPVEGVIVEVNGTIRENPEMASARPYEDGWIFLVRHNDIKKMMKRLMEDTDGVDWLSSEVKVLEGMIEEVAGPLAADGGQLAPDIYGNLPDLGWSSLTRTFLKTGS
jgi:glycine cleavage system H lipoate-binding protein